MIEENNVNGIGSIVFKEQVLHHWHTHCVYIDDDDAEWVKERGEKQRSQEQGENKGDGIKKNTVSLQTIAKYKKEGVIYAIPLITYPFREVCSLLDLLCFSMSSDI